MIETRTSFTQLQASVEASMARARELRAASLAIQQRVIETQREITEVFFNTQATFKEVRQHLALLGSRPVERSVPEIEPEPANAPLQVLVALERDESDLEEMIDDLIAAYKAASACGDDSERTLFANALMQIGRHLATQVGPRAAGVIMN
ncbi:hypothetical protein [Methylobacterium sp. SD21]|uniref:hypothetical protein n=1 Tax=Methylobacterium litchii TaxID=3138810 RepID=UPI00313B1FC8